MQPIQAEEQSNKGLYILLGCAGLIVTGLCVATGVGFCMMGTTSVAPITTQTSPLRRAVAAGRRGSVAPSPQVAVGPQHPLRRAAPVSHNPIRQPALPSTRYVA